MNQRIWEWVSQYPEARNSRLFQELKAVIYQDLGPHNLANYLEYAANTLVLLADPNEAFKNIQDYPDGHMADRLQVKSILAQMQPPEIKQLLNKENAKLYHKLCLMAISHKHPYWEKICRQMEQ